MPAEGPRNGWAVAAAEYIAAHLPIDKNAAGNIQSWNHEFSSTTELGCEALVALGYADEIPTGAVPRPSPALPPVPPRWDDICIAVLELGRLEFLSAEESKSGSRRPPLLVFGKSYRPWEPLIVPVANGLGAVQSDADTSAVLEALGLLERGRWSPIAETVLWRVQPSEWQLDVVSDERFKHGVSVAADNMPADLATAVEQLATISEDDVEVALESSRANLREMRERYGPNARIFGAESTSEARGSLEAGRRHQLDRLFSRRWRLDDGWLTPEQGLRALEVSHDPLSIQTRQAVMAARYPDAPFLAVRF